MERWLPRGFFIEQGITVGKQLSEGQDWQLYSTSGRGFSVAVSSSLYESWMAHQVLPADLFQKYDLPNREIWLAFDSHDSPIISIRYGPYPNTYEDALACAVAIKNSRISIPGPSFENGLYFERYSLILPTYEGENLDDQSVLYRWIASGVAVSRDRFDRLCEIASWMAPTALAQIVREAGFSISTDMVSWIENQAKEKNEGKATTSDRAKSVPDISEHFSLPGRPALETFFNEHIVDIIRNIEKYQHMGIAFPGAIILHGPPGCGKTFAVEKLIEFLGWSSFYIDSSTIGSPFIHDTGKKISEVFDKAIQEAPSVVVIDEMEAFLSARNMFQDSGLYHMEEVAEFLRRIPEAAKMQVLVIAMTNLIQSIDPAILRKGRFDYIIEVDFPSQEEVNGLLHHLLKDLPVRDDIDYEGISSCLKGHAISDVAFVVKEAGRLAVKRNEDTITNDFLCEAIKSLPKAEDVTRRIGF